ncbi:MAG: LacI family DNA-binding transcriptional regulator [Oscillospiraceae bacterium]|nr:LacI family DNA-binding transcriptional regulator [Oscillospiraceae bacterium]
MAVTIKQISEICGVSRGTVDRVLNNRGKVKPETEELVRRVAEQLGYVPNFAAKTLAAKKKSLSIGIITVSEGNAFFDEVFRGIKQAESEISPYGARLVKRTMKGYDTKIQLDIMREIRDEIDVLILNPISDPLVAKEIDNFADCGIPVITMNNDIENSKRLCYVGSDYIKGGETACGMLGIITGGKANIAVLTGSIKVLGHAQRILGFKNVMHKKYPNFNVVTIEETNDDEIQAYDAARRVLESNKGINAIFVVAGGVYGVCRAVMSLGLEERISIVCFDAVPTTVEMMEKGIIKATICQQPYTQGYKSVKIAFDFLVSGKAPEKERYIVKNEIKIQENL